MPQAQISVREGATYETLAAQHKNFVDKFIETGNAVLSAEFAGYADGMKTEKYNASIKAKARKLREMLAHIIDERVQVYARSADMAVLGLNVLKQLAQEADSETVRLNAAKEIVSRCIEAQTQKKEVTHKIKLSDLKDEDLDKRIEALRQELNGNVIDVTPEEVSAA